MARRQSGGRTQAAVFLGVSVFAAAVAAVVIYYVVQGYQRDLLTAQAPEETIEVMVAGVDLHPGRTIVQADLSVKQLPPDYVPDSVLRQPEQVIGRVPRERVLKGDLIRDERLADAEAGVGLNAIIPRGMRAIAIAINGSSAVSGFINPGNYVDVLATVPSMDRENGVETVTLLQAVTVLAVNNRLGGGQTTSAERARPSVTLAVTPEQAEKLTHAANSGSITLSLRTDIDVTHVTTHGAMASELLGADKEQRMTVSEWRERIVKQQDGTLIIIKGPTVRTESSKPAGR